MTTNALKNMTDSHEPNVPFQQHGEEVDRIELSSIFMQEVSNNLDSFIADQKKEFASTDGSFLTLGQDMQQLYSKTTELTDKIRKSTEVISGGEEEGVLSRLGQSISGALTELETCQGDVGFSLQQVAVVSKGMNDFHAMCPTLDGIAKFLRVIGLNICVECSQSPEASKLFMSHAEEIKDFAEEVIRINKDIRYDSQSTRDVLTASHTNIGQSLKRLQSLSDSAAKIVEEAFSGIQQLMNLSLAAMDQASSHSGNISAQVGEIVMGIQFHDNMSQRIEHIHTALHEASQHCSADDENSTNAAKIAEVYAITVIQSGQIREIIAGIEDVFQSNRQAFFEIGNEVAGLAEVLISLTSGNNEPRSSRNARQQEDSFTTLQSALLELRQLLDYGTEQIELIHEANKEASDTADRLENHIGLLRSISNDTHIKALNTIILANHLGPEGRTIEVLAKEIKDIASQANTYVGDVENVCQVLLQTITTLKASNGKETSSATSHSALLDTNIQETTTAYHSFVDDSAFALQYAVDLGKEISEISEKLEFLPTLATALKDNLTKLDELTQQLSPWAGQMSSEAKTRAARLADRYTMDEERVIHQEAFGETDDSSTEEFELFGEDSDDMDIEMFDQEPESGDLELFDESLEAGDFEMFGEETAPHEEITTQSSQDSDGIELFDHELEEKEAEERKSSRKKKTEGQATKTVNGAEGGELGGNFELF